MTLTGNEIRLLRKPPAKWVGRDKRVAEELVGKGALRPTGDNQYTLTKAGSEALKATDPKAT